MRTLEDIERDYEKAIAEAEHIIKAKEKDVNKMEERDKNGQ